MEDLRCKPTWIQELVKRQRRKSGSRRTFRWGGREFLCELKLHAEVSSSIRCSLYERS
jgi:hypothetical protein